MTAHLDRVLLTADVVYNGMGLPVNDGAVLVAGGNVVSFGKAAELRAREPGVPERRAGRAILPRPVNAHTHLDMTRFPYKELPYGQWIPWVVERSREGLRGLDGAREGLAMLRQAGVGAFGDIVAKYDVLDFLLQESPLPGVAYHEVLDPNPATAGETFAAALARLERWRAMERPGMVRLGLSPHTAHTVSSVLLQRLARHAQREDLPLQVHIAEAPEELRIFQHGDGPVAEGITRAFGVTVRDILGRDPEPGLTPVRHLADLGVLDARPTIVHGVNVSEDDVRLIAQAGCPVVHCPRSNRALSCGTLPWALYARHGVEVGIGTDSVASGRTLDPLDEVRAALEAHGGALSLAAAVRSVVKGGYRALGMRPPMVRRGDPFGSLAVWPDGRV
ncbi:MAG TPA: amidohydrolase family protein [Deinococcales bacterium]|nr:amidohydrolase family protein [Deinococcales bacterium]